MIVGNSQSDTEDNAVVSQPAKNRPCPICGVSGDENSFTCVRNTARITSLGLPFSDF